MKIIAAIIAELSLELNKIQKEQNLTNEDMLKILKELGVSYLIKIKYNKNITG